VKDLVLSLKNEDCRAALAMTMLLKYKSPVRRQGFEYQEQPLRLIIYDFLLTIGAGSPLRACEDDNGGASRHPTKGNHMGLPLHKKSPLLK